MTSTEPTEVPPRDWIESLPWPRRVTEGRELLALFTAETGTEPVMWGPSIVGYGTAHYRYDSGREGDWMRVGFSPRKAAISLYGLQYYGSNADRIVELGKVRLGAGCVYVNKLADIDLAALRGLVAHAWSESLATSPD